MTKEEQVLTLLSQQKIKADDKAMLQQVASAIDWSYVIKLASFHKIDNFIYNNAKTNQLLNIFPDKIATLLKVKYYRVALLNKELKECTENIASLCYKNRITLIKGTSLLYDFYEDLGARYMGDVDIMVRKSERKAIWNALLRGGWCCDNWPGYKSKYHEMLSDIEYKTMHYIYRETDNGRIFLDIHWKFFCGEADELIADEAFDTDRKIDSNIYVHSNEMQFIHLCTNNYLDYTQNGVIFMRNLCDINEFLLSRPIRWNKVEQILKMQSEDTIMRNAVVLGLNCVNKLFSTAIPVQYQSSVLEGREITPTMLTHCGTAQVKLTFKQTLRKKIKTLGTTPRVLGFIFKSIFPEHRWLKGVFKKSTFPLCSYWSYIIKRHILHKLDRLEY